MRTLKFLRRRYRGKQTLRTTTKPAAPLQPADANEGEEDEPEVRRSTRARRPPQMFTYNSLGQPTFQFQPPPAVHAVEAFLPPAEYSSVRVCPLDRTRNIYMYKSCGKNDSRMLQHTVFQLSSAPHLRRLHTNTLAAESGAPRTPAGANSTLLLGRLMMYRSVICLAVLVSPRVHSGGDEKGTGRMSGRSARSALEDNLSEQSSLYPARSHSTHSIRPCYRPTSQTGHD
uniref:Uncharacterized protein n=1 Tax=Knipowitschia caucasica TaxID=637954 RepID=A0AAV2KEN5_KNICA